MACQEKMRYLHFHRNQHTINSNPCSGYSAQSYDDYCRWWLSRSYTLGRVIRK